MWLHQLVVMTCQSCRPKRTGRHRQIVFATAAQIQGHSRGELLARGRWVGDVPSPTKHCEGRGRPKRPAETGTARVGEDVRGTRCLAQCADRIGTGKRVCQARRVGGDSVIHNHNIQARRRNDLCHEKRIVGGTIVDGITDELRSLDVVTIAVCRGLGNGPT